MPARAEEPTGGSQRVRSSDEVGNDHGAKGHRKVKSVKEPTTENQPASVAATPQQAGETRPPRDPWWWVERTVWTERMLTRFMAREPANRNGLPAVGC